MQMLTDLYQITKVFGLDQISNIVRLNIAKIKYIHVFVYYTWTLCTIMHLKKKDLTWTTKMTAITEYLILERKFEFNVLNIMQWLSQALFIYPRKT